MSILDMSDEADIPEFIQKHEATLRFPEKLMLLITFVERELSLAGGSPRHACIEWTIDGKALIVRNVEELVTRIFPLVFRQKPKFTSFTRKLYRWGFRRIKKGVSTKNGAGEILVYGSENFQRDNRQLLANMRSTTAEKDRKAKSITYSTTAPAAESTSEHVLSQEGPEPFSMNRYMPYRNDLPVGHALLSSLLRSSSFHRRRQDVVAEILGFTAQPTIANVPPSIAQILAASVTRQDRVVLARQLLPPSPSYPYDQSLRHIQHVQMIDSQARDDIVSALQIVATRLSHEYQTPLSLSPPPPRR